MVQSASHAAAADADCDHRAHPDIACLSLPLLRASDFDRFRQKQPVHAPMAKSEIRQSCTGAAGTLQGADSMACLSGSTACHFPTDLKLILKP